MQITGMLWGRKLLDLVEFPHSEVRGPELGVDDIKDIWVKWGRGTLEFKDGTLFHFEEDDTGGHEFYKEPIEVDILFDGLSANISDEVH